MEKGKIKVTAGEHENLLFFLDVLYEGCDITDPIISEICIDGIESVRPSLEKYKGQNIEDIKGKQGV